MHDIVFVGDSWALKGFTEENYRLLHEEKNKQDICLADMWEISYQTCFSPGRGNLSVLKKLLAMDIPSTVPIVWVWTEPARDYNKITGRPHHEWMQREDVFELRKQLESDILDKIKHSLKNPIAFIGGLSDIDPDKVIEHGFYLIHPSWQKWMADSLQSRWFKFGWGALDVGWRFHNDGIQPGSAALDAWDELIKEWCWWEQQGYMCHEHPTPRSVMEFGNHLKSKVRSWLVTL